MRSPQRAAPLLPPCTWPLAPRGSHTTGCMCCSRGSPWAGAGAGAGAGSRQTCHPPEASIVQGQGQGSVQPRFRAEGEDQGSVQPRVRDSGYSIAEGQGSVQLRGSWVISTCTHECIIIHLATDCHSTDTHTCVAAPRHTRGHDLRTSASRPALAELA